MDPEIIYYLIHSSGVMLCTDDVNIAEFAEQNGWRQVSSQVYENAQEKSQKRRDGVEFFNEQE